MTNTFFIPINSNSLAHYFGKAIILPSRFYTNKHKDIIQDRYSNSTLLSHIKWIKDSDCSIEIVLTDAEVGLLNRKSKTFCLLNIPVPISRVKSIWFLDKKQREYTIWNINNGSAFVPDHIINVEPTSKTDFDCPDNLPPDEQTSSVTKLETKINQFDTLLGGFAFMRIGGKPFMNYSLNYFSTLSYFNKLVENQTSKAEKEIGIKFSQKYTALFSTNESEWKKWLKYIYKNVDQAEVEEIAHFENIKIDKKYGIFSMDSISHSTHLYEIAVLATYGDGKTKSADNLVTDIRNGRIPDEKVEDVSIVFGLSNGYSRLRNSYRTADSENLVKFKLESKLDYYTIESIYQFVFNSVRDSTTFSYIDNWCQVATENRNMVNVETYMIIDTEIIFKKKQSPLEVFLETSSKEIYYSIIKAVNTWLPPFAKSDEKEAIRFFEVNLRTPFSKAITQLQREIETGLKSKFDVKRIEQESSFQIERDKLTSEIKNLHEEISKLKANKLTSEVTSIDGASSGENISKSNVEEDTIVDEPLEKYRPVREETKDGEKGTSDLENIKPVVGVTTMQISSIKEDDSKHENIPMQEPDIAGDLPDNAKEHPPAQSKSQNDLKLKPVESTPDLTADNNSLKLDFDQQHPADKKIKKRTRKAKS